MNALEKVLYKTHKTLAEGYIECGDNDLDIHELEQCSHCGVWRKTDELLEDDDDNLICGICHKFYGL